MKKLMLALVAMFSCALVFAGDLVISTPDKVVFGTENRIGRDQIGYLKKMADGSTLYLEEVRTGKRELAAQSMRKYPATMNAESILSTLDPNARSDGGSPQARQSARTARPDAESENRHRHR